MAGNFLSAFIHRDYSPIGLDVGRDSLKMLQLRRRAGQWEVAAGGICPFNGEQGSNPAQRWRQVAGVVKAMLTGPSRLGFRGRRLVAALGQEQVVVKNARLPKMPAEELAEAVRWEAAERFPFDVGRAVVRYLPAGEIRQGGEQREEVLLFAVEEPTLRETLTTLEKAGCRPVGLDAQPLALARAAEFFMPPDADPEAVTALTDLGGRGCQVLICRGGRIVFVKSIDIGSQDLTRAVVGKVGLSPEETSTLRQRLASGQPDAPTPESTVYRTVLAAMRPVAERLAQEITLCLRYYSVTFRGSRPDRVTVVGGAAHDQMLLHLLSEALGLEVQVGRPLATCSPSPAVCQWGRGLASGGPEWAVALGCCLKPLVASGGSAGQLSTADSAAGRPDLADAVAEQELAATT